jgi:hypothetical protein
MCIRAVALSFMTEYFARKENPRPPHLWCYNIISPSPMISRLFPLIALPFLLASCSGDSAPQESAQQEESASIEKPKTTASSKRKSYTAEELNAPYSTVSPWRYIVTSPETQYFERLVGKSTIARTVHGSGHAILVPQDESFTQNADWKGILEEGQEEALDRFVKAHVIIGIEGPKMLEGIYENLNGAMVSIEKNDKGELVCGGARLMGREVETDGGLVIPVIGMAEDIQWN